MGLEAYGLKIFTNVGSGVGDFLRHQKRLNLIFGVPILLCNFWQMVVSPEWTWEEGEI